MMTPTHRHSRRSRNSSPARRWHWASTSVGAPDRRPTAASVPIEATSAPHNIRTSAASCSMSCAGEKESMSDRKELSEDPELSDDSLLQGEADTVYAELLARVGE